MMQMERDDSFERMVAAHVIVTGTRALLNADVC